MEHLNDLDFVLEDDSGVKDEDELAEEIVQMARLSEKERADILK